MPFDRRIAFEAVVAKAISTGSTGSKLFTARGYRQTDKPACRGGKANLNGFRIKNAALPALAASFATKPFITAHDWGDARARGGTISKVELERLPGEHALVFEIFASAAWAIEGLENGNIDRFSIGAMGEGEITCTIHDAPVWTECYCLPLLELDGKICEWEYERARGVELSAVNVPAVDGCELIAFEAAPPTVEQLAELCGRGRPTVPVAINLEALQLSLTEERTRTAALEAQILRQHMTSELERFERARETTPELLASLRSSATAGRAAFDAALALATLAARTRLAEGAAPRVRAVLQSDSRPAEIPGMRGGADEPDAYELHVHNPELPRLMRLCGLKAEDVRKHGARAFNIVPELRQVMAATDERGG